MATVPVGSTKSLKQRPVRGETVKVTVNLPSGIVEAVQEMATRRNTTMTEVIRDSIATERYLRDRIKDHSKILIEDETGTSRELLFKPEA